GTVDIPIRYAGYYCDSETGLYYLKSRYYSPETGRFLTKDTVKGVNADPKTLNLYTYAEGNPIMNVDPDGHLAWKKVERGASYVAGGAATIALFAVALSAAPVVVTGLTVIGLGATVVSGTISGYRYYKSGFKDKGAGLNTALSVAGAVPGFAAARGGANLASGAKAGKVVANVASNQISKISAGVTYATAPKTSSKSSGKSSSSSAKKSTKSGGKKR
ncbi:MAG: RHS repeat-associated core domain-containing protein, partial [Actinomycetota bacterium]|nr:RHS repeat-associated core domain-containing protein [Actinomycetota bacterium]